MYKRQICVLSGEATLDDLEKSDTKPTWIFDSVREVCTELALSLIHISPMTTNPDDKKPKQVLATYAVVALIVMFLLNIFVLPGIMERSKMCIRDRDS